MSRVISFTFYVSLVFLAPWIPAVRGYVMGDAAEGTSILGLLTNLGSTGVVLFVMWWMFRETAARFDKAIEAFKGEIGEERRMCREVDADTKQQIVGRLERLSDEVRAFRTYAPPQRPARPQA